MGYQLCCLFIIILIHCAPVDPHWLWEASKEHLCDNLCHQLIRDHHILEPTQDRIHDYGLYLIDQELRRHGKHLENFPSMPRPQRNWGHQEGIRLINEQLAYDRQEQ
jgi:hypothetical protein